jgi:hypothetical protein
MQYTRPGKVSSTIWKIAESRIPVGCSLARGTTVAKDITLAELKSWYVTYRNMLEEDANAPDRRRYILDGQTVTRYQWRQYWYVKLEQTTELVWFAENAIGMVDWRD